ncbi:MAG: hypothetical protein ACYTBJ_06630, partial [Planctomycetota bacterium]
QKAIECLGEEPKNIWQLWKKWPADMNETELTPIKQWVSSNSEALTHLRRGTEKPYVWIKMVSPDGSLMKATPEIELDKIRELAFLAGCRAKREAMDGNITGGIEDLLTNHRLSLHFTGPYRLWQFSIGTVTTNDAFHILDRCEVDARALERLQKVLQQRFDFNRSLPDFRYERLAVYDFIQRAFTDDGKGNGRLIPSQLPNLAPDFFEPHYGYGDDSMIGIAKETWMQFSRDSRADLLRIALMGPDRRKTTAMADKLFAYLETVKRQTPWQLNSKLIKPHQQMKSMLEGYSVLKLAPPVCAIEGFYMSRVNNLFSRYEASRSALIAVLAILRYRQDNNVLPESLNELVEKGYLPGLRVDPFGEGPLVYRRTGDHFVLYSLGADFVDDDGLRSAGRRSREWGDYVFWPVEQPPDSPDTEDRTK